mmetsp:Transcript_7349/g.18004  ORF Transcript_7349/g.18004 Transcript_7349/m.18004 type:complete len:224 (+) Transcript_7349:101-772(+)
MTDAALVKELRFDPCIFLSDVRNFVNDYVCDATDLLESSLVGAAPPHQLGESIEEVFSMDMDELDVQLEKLDMYSLRNIFILPADHAPVVDGLKELETPELSDSDDRALHLEIEERKQNLAELRRERLQTMVEANAVEEEILIYQGALEMVNLEENVEVGRKLEHMRKDVQESLAYAREVQKKCGKPRASAAARRKTSLLDISNTLFRNNTIHEMKQGAKFFA